MLSFLLFTALSTFTTRDGKFVDFNQKERKSKSVREKGWYFIQFQEQINYDQLRNKYGIPIGLENKLLGKIYKVFLTSRQVSVLKRIFHARVIEFRNKDKLTQNSQIPFNEATRICLSVDSSFRFSDHFESISKNPPIFNPKGNLLFNKHFQRTYQGQTLSHKDIQNIEMNMTGIDYDDLNVFSYKGMNISRLSSDLIAIDVDDFLGSVNFFKNIDSVSDISPCSRVKLANRFHNGILQGSPDPVRYNDRWRNPRIYYDIGINGSGEYALVSDTGIDVRHTFFYDPGKTVPYYSRGNQHRKIVYYYNYNGDENDDNGHGTHTTCTCLGAALDRDSGISNYDGQAPGAKLVVFDGSAINNLLFFVPDDIAIEKIMTEVPETSIHSGSWQIADEVDQSFRVMMEKREFISHPKLLEIIAAGNDGPKEHSLNTATTSKNLITVANAYNYANEYNLLTFEIDSTLKAYDLLVKYDGNEEIVAVKHAFYSQDPWLGVKDAMSEFTVTFNEEQATREHFVFMDTIDLKKTDLYNSKLGGIIVNSRTSPKIDKNLKIPVIRFPVGKTVPEGAKIQRKFNIEKYEDGIHDRSSRGPSIYGTMKPDVAGYGTEIISARSDNGAYENSLYLCAFSGTSQATPMVSGTALLIRQYVREKLLVSQPTSTLVRSLLISACDQISNISTKKRPNSLSGHGVPRLINVLPIDTSFKLLVSNRVDISKNEHLVSEIDVTSKDHDLRIAMSYLDAPTNAAGYPVLHCNLDLYIVSPSQKVIYGNHYDNLQSEYYSTNERILLTNDEVEIGRYSIHIVSSGDFGQYSTFSFSLCVSGVIHSNNIESDNSNSLTFAKSTKCDQCLNGGTCDNSKQLCQCQNGYVGLHCQIKESTISNSKGKSQKYSIEANELKYFMVKLPTDYNEYKLTFNPVDEANFSHHWLWYSSKSFSVPFEAEEVVRFQIGNVAITTKEITITKDTYVPGSSIHFAFHNNYRFPFKISITVDHDGNDADLPDPEPESKPTQSPAPAPTPEQSPAPSPTPEPEQTPTPTLEQTPSQTKVEIKQTNGDADDYISQITFDQSENGPENSTNDIEITNTNNNDNNNNNSNDDNNQGSVLQEGGIAGIVIGIIITISIGIVITIIILKKKNEEHSSDKEMSLDLSMPSFI
ncbi:hypothetical protein TRFO_07494 [Tritrichomonas foetus]|uniref:EGF-like domain-containing protein n=1 Tax=Tritrichomonas foetus TaxID=1144522 RepID=A0A1J4JS59_9EUKA|nr:hypothetical protein TRFO_07494 [Tritrichomonas foetus]|eukprot:OHT01594.1 hypothetical protein TRFO_07494 [Tritrichomonas foetus]